MDLDTESGKAVAPMDLDSVSDKSAAIIEEERPVKKVKHDRRFGTTISDADEYRSWALNRYQHLGRFEQRMCLLAACSTVHFQEVAFQRKNKTILSEDDMVEVKALVLKKAEMIGEDASALHAHIRNPSWQPCILNDDIRHEIVKGLQDYRMKMKAVAKLEYIPDACSETKFHQSDDQKRKEMLVKKATEKRFPDFVW